MRGLLKKSWNVQEAQPMLIEVGGSQDSHIISCNVIRNYKVNPVMRIQSKKLYQRFKIS